MGLIIGLISCKKNAEKMITIEVVEYKTNIPISGATVEFYKPGDSIPSCNCRDVEKFLTKQTDASGKCTATEADFIKASDLISVSKENYWWSAVTPNKTRCELSPVGQIALHVIPMNSYPVGSFMGVSCHGYQDVSRLINLDEFFVPVDSSFIFNAFGGQTNTIAWTVYNPSSTSILDSGSLQIEVAKSGITNAELKY